MMKRNLLMCTAFLSLVGCASRSVQLVQAEWTSMTHAKVPAANEVVEAGPVRGEYCYSSFNSGDVGLMDEAITNAQTKNSVDYIRNANFQMDVNKSCVTVEGQGYKSKKTL